MQYDFRKASQYAGLLREKTFMQAMSKIAMSSMGLVADSPSTKGEKFEAYANNSGIADKQQQLANSMEFCDMGMPSANCDGYAVAQMTRLLMKDNTLTIAFQSGVVAPEELKTLDIPSGVITAEGVNALQQMGMKSLASVAEFYVK
jgi:hypothetical protein